MAGENDVPVPADRDTNLSFIFEDGKKFAITEHFFKLSGFIRDIPESMHSENPATFPVKDFSSKSFEIVTSLLKLLKHKDSKDYVKALKGEAVSLFTLNIHI